MSFKVCVVGAGAAGLNALRHLKSKPDFFTVIAYEQASNIGGTWVYTENTGKDQHGFPVHSSMYKNLKTNLPKEVMAFPDFPFSKKLSSFIGHKEVLDYLICYAKHFDLWNYIQFNSRVERIYPIQKQTETFWKVVVQNLATYQRQELEFNAVMICNGNNFEPLYPEVPGTESFSGRIMHSHEYRSPEVFKDQIVYCLGAQSSGIDISLEISKYCKQVFLGHRKPKFSCPFPQNFSQVQGLRKVESSKLILEDDSEIENVDTIIFCTGYAKSFPFLDSTCDVTIKEYSRVIPLYKHCIHIEYPTLTFIAVPKIICPFPLFDCQVKFIMASFEGAMVLPSRQEMEKDANMDFEERIKSGLPSRHAHILGHRQWKYNDDLAELAGFTKIPSVIQKIYNFVHEERPKDFIGYRHFNFEICDENSFTVINP